MREIIVNPLSTNEKAQIQRAYGDLMQNNQLKVSLILGKKTEGAYDPNSGLKADTWTREPIWGLRGDYSNQDLALGVGMFLLRESTTETSTAELGEVYFLLIGDNYIEELGADLDHGDRVYELRYEAGGATVTNASATITGSGTEWLKNAGKGDWFRVKTEDSFYEISSVASDISLTLLSNYTGLDKTTRPYEIHKEYMVVRVEKDPLGVLRKVHCRRLR